MEPIGTRTRGGRIAIGQLERSAAGAGAGAGAEYAGGAGLRAIERGHQRRQVSAESDRTALEAHLKARRYR
jgi:hypothetical protein